MQEGGPPCPLGRPSSHFRLPADLTPNDLLHGHENPT